jgi:cytochrome c
MSAMRAPDSWNAILSWLLVGVVWAGTVAVAGDSQQGAAAAAPEISIHFSGNQTFFFDGREVEYLVVASDPAVGDTLSGTLSSDAVEVFAHNSVAGAPSPQLPAVAAGAVANSGRGRGLVANSDCRLCHTRFEPSFIPSFQTIADKYRSAANGLDQIADKVIQGGKAEWAGVLMPAHPDFTTQQAHDVAAFVLSFSTQGGGLQRLALYGKTVLPTPLGDSSRLAVPASGDRFEIIARYSPRGRPNTPPLIARSSLRKPIMPAMTADQRLAIAPTADACFKDAGTIAHGGAMLVFRRLDLTDVAAVSLQLDAARPLSADDRVVVRIDGFSGQTVGTADLQAAVREEQCRTSSINLNRVGGIHDVYVFFEGNDLSDGSLHVGSITFHVGGTT